MVVKSVSIPVIPLPGSEGWAGAYEVGIRLEARFPNQDAYDFCMALEYNDWGPTVNHEIVSLVLEKAGYPDEESWIWRVGLDDGSSWLAEGSCDYTGWDCQSRLTWTKM